MASVLKSSVVTLVSQFVLVALSFAAEVLVSRILGPERRGIYSLLIIIPVLAFNFASFGIDSSNIYFTSKNEYKLSVIFSNSLFFTFFITIVSALAFFFVFEFPSIENYCISKGLLRVHLLIALLAVPFYSIFMYMIYIYIGRQQIVLYSKINILKALVQLICVIVFLFFLHSGLKGALLSYFLSFFIPLLVIFYLAYKEDFLKWDFDRNFLKKSFTYGLKVHFANLAQYLNYRLDTLMIAYFLMPVQVGYYSLSVSIAERLWLIPSAFSTVLFPHVASGDAKSNDLTPKITRHVVFIELIMCLGIIVLGRLFIQLFFGAVYLPATLPLFYLLPGILAVSISKILSADLAGKGKPHYATYASTTALVINVVLNIVLIPKWGISGAALASSITYIGANLVLIYFSGRKWQDLLIIKASDFLDYKQAYQRYLKKS